MSTTMRVDDTSAIDTSSMSVDAALVSMWGELRFQ